MNAAILVNTDDTHLTAEEVAAFLDRRMAPTDRGTVEVHLADCERCRGELAAVRRLLAASPPRRSSAFLPLGLTAAAAAVVAIVLFNVDRNGSEAATERIRIANETLRTDASQRIAAVSPADGDTVRSPRLALVWSALAGEPTYRLTLTDAGGRPVWTRATTDTSVTLPNGIVLQSRSTYFWYVDALRADGRAASTGVHRFATP